MIALWFWRLAVVLSFWAVMVERSDAKLDISVCGHSQYDCPVLIRDGDNALENTPVGSVMGPNKVCDTASGKCVYVAPNPNTLGPTPSGWTSYTQPPATAVRQTQGISNWGTCNAITGSGCSGSPTDPSWAFASAEDVKVASTAANGGCSYQDSAGGPWPKFNGNKEYYRFDILSCANPPTGLVAGAYATRMVASCPPGYTDTGSACNLSNASLVPKPADGNCTIIRNGNSYAGDPKDPDCLVSGSTPAAVVGLSGNGGGTVGQSKDGDTAQQKQNANGTGQITITFQNTNGTSTTIQYNISAPNGSGQQTVTGGKVSTMQGVGDLAGQGGDSTGEICGASPLPPCNVKIDETGTPTAESANTALAEKKTAYDEAVNAAKGVIESTGPGGSREKTVLGISWGVNLPSHSCSNLQFGVSHKPLGEIPICERIGDINATTNWLFGVLTGLSIFLIGVNTLRSA